MTVTRTADYAASILPRLLRFEPLDLPICPVDSASSLLCCHLLLQILFVLLPRLHLIADQGAAEQANRQHQCRHRRRHCRWRSTSFERDMSDNWTVDHYAISTSEEPPVRRSQR